MSVPRLLSDEQYAAFLRDGYLEVTPESLGSSDHDFLYQRAADLYELTASTRSKTAHLDILGDNLRAQIPEIELLLNDPAVDGALTSLLGPDYLLHPHSYCHRSFERDQIFHQDGNLPWNERGHYRTHQPEWVMLFYYPQDVDESNGPTEVVAGSQYWTIDHETDDGRWHPGDRVDRSVDEDVFGGDDLSLRDRTQTAALEAGLPIPDLDRRFVHVAKGTVLLAHYDLFHRGSRTEGHPQARYLYKFYFARTREPTVPAWAALSPPKPPDLSKVRSDLRPVVAANWRWAVGKPGGQLDAASADEPPTELLVDQLLTGVENERVEAAYLLGERASDTDHDALAGLRRALWADVEAARRAAGHGLRQAGLAGLDVLLHGLADGPAPTRRVSVAALGTVVAAARPDAVSAVVRAADDDPDDLVRSNAAYSLGQMARRHDGNDGNDGLGGLGGGPDLDLIVDTLLRRLSPGAEPDNAFNVGLSRSTVRQSAAFALVQVMANHSLRSAQVEAIVDGPLHDADRYVQGLVVAGLAKAEQLPAEAQRKVIDFLTARRWNRSAGVPPMTAGSGAAQE